MEEKSKKWYFWTKSCGTTQPKLSPVLRASHLVCDGFLLELITCCGIKCLLKLSARRFAAALRLQATKSQYRVGK